MTPTNGRQQPVCGRTAAKYMTAISKGANFSRTDNQLRGLRAAVQDHAGGAKGLIDCAAASRPAVLVIFDVLHADGRDLRPLPLPARQEWLPATVASRTGLHVTGSVRELGEALFAIAVDNKHRGYSRQEAHGLRR